MLSILEEAISLRKDPHFEFLSIRAIELKNNVNEPNENSVVIQN